MIRKKSEMTRLPVQVMQVSDNLYIADMGNDNLVQVEMKGTSSLSGELLEAYSVSSSDGKINGYFEQKPGNSPIELIQAMVNFHLVQQDIQKSGIGDE